MSLSIMGHWDMMLSRRSMAEVIPREITSNLFVTFWVSRIRRMYGVSSVIRSSRSVLMYLLPVVKARLQHSVICSGYLVVSQKWVGFWSKSLTLGDQRYRIPSSTVLGAVPIEPRIRCGFLVYTFQLDIQGHTSLRFQLYSERNRDEAIKRVRLVMGVNSLSSPPSTPTRSSKSETSSTVKRSSSVLAPISRALDKRIHTNLSLSTEIILQLPKAVNLPKDALYPMPPMHFVCLTIGSRGDVQPYIALALGLKSEGHSVTIVTHPEYKSWIESFGVEHRAAGGDPGMLMKLSVENKVSRYYYLLRYALKLPPHRCSLPSSSKRVLQTWVLHSLFTSASEVTAGYSIVHGWIDVCQMTNPLH